jgi:DNA-binding NarL/FixJ family response regulator
VAVRILIADDHKIFRDGLRSLIENQPGLAVIGEAENGRSALHLARVHRPDVVIMDISMPDLNGVDATRQMIAALPGVKVIALSIHSDSRYVIGMLRAGASGFLLKDCAFEELVHAIATVRANHIYLCAGVTGIIVEDYLRRSPSNGSRVGAVLTAREREVLQLLAEGWSTKEISSHLHVSVKTVETHRRQIMAKLQIHTIAGLTKYAIREGLTCLE